LEKWKNQGKTQNQNPEFLDPSQVENQFKYRSKGAQDCYQPHSLLQNSLSNGYFFCSKKPRKNTRKSTKTNLLIQAKLKTSSNIVPRVPGLRQTAPYAE